MKELVSLSRSRRLILLITLGLFCSGTAFGADPSRDMSQYFAGKTITIIVGSAPGGAADFNARLFSQFSSKQFPGNPKFVVQNIPGGGQLKGLQTAMRAKPDGLTVGTLHPRWVVASIMGEDLKPFNVKTARVVGSPNAVKVGGLICADRKVFRTWKDVVASSEPLKVGASATGARESLGAGAVSLVKGPIKMIYGYGGVAEVAAAFDRGELTGIGCSEDTVPRLFPEWLTQKRLVPLFWWGAAPDEAYLRRLGATEKPHNVFELPGVSMAQEGKAVLQTALEMHRFTRAFVLPPGIPDDLYNVWLKSYEATIKNPDYMKASDAGGIDAGHGRAEDFREAIKLADKLSPEGLKLFKQLMGEGG